MKIEVNITKTKFFIILASIVLLFASFGVYAYNANASGGNAAVFGHSADEVTVKMSDGSMKTVQSLLSGETNSGNAIFLIDNPPIAFSTTHCTAGGNATYYNNWRVISLQNLVPSFATKAIFNTYCSEHRIYYRPTGSTTGIANALKLCSTENDDSDTSFQMVTLDSSKAIEIYNVGTDCPTGSGIVSLIGYL